MTQLVVGSRIAALLGLAAAALGASGCQMLLGDFEEEVVTQAPRERVCDRKKGTDIYFEDTGEVAKVCDLSKGLRCLAEGSGPPMCAECSSGDGDCSGEIGSQQSRVCVDGAWQAPVACGAGQRCSSDDGCVDCVFGETQCVTLEGGQLAEQTCSSGGQWVKGRDCGVFDGQPAECFNSTVTDTEESRTGRCRSCIEGAPKCVSFGGDDFRTGNCVNGERKSFDDCAGACDAKGEACL